MEIKISKRRIFLSYGHDEYAALAEQLKKDLLEQGHEVWFDLDRLKFRGDWEYILRKGLNGLLNFPAGGRCVLLITPHYVHHPMDIVSTRLPETYRSFGSLVNKKNLSKTSCCDTIKFKNTCGFNGHQNTSHSHTQGSPPLWEYLGDHLIGGCHSALR